MRVRWLATMFFASAFGAWGCAVDDSAEVVDPNGKMLPPVDSGGVDGSNTPSDDVTSGFDGSAPGDPDASTAPTPTDGGTPPPPRDGSVDRATTPAGVEICNNGTDDDRDGMVDENCPCAPGMTQMCYPGDARQRNVGACRSGTQRCEGTGEFGNWGACTGAVTPAEDVCGDGVDNDCDGATDNGASCCRAGTTGSCYSGPSGTLGVGICRAGTRTCTPQGTPGPCMGEVLPRAENCNGTDDNCDGRVDESCRACIASAGTGGGGPWQMHYGQGPQCWGRTFGSHGEVGEYAFARIPAETDPGWMPHTPEAISFSDPSTLCGVCECRAGGDFTYFQTTFFVPASYTVSSLVVTIRDVDDGVSVAVFNSRYPNGIVDPGAFAYLGGGSTANLASYVVPGRNRVVLTHVDDCCMVRQIANATIALNGSNLGRCP